MTAPGRLPLRPGRPLVHRRPNGAWGRTCHCAGRGPLHATTSEAHNLPWWVALAAALDHATHRHPEQPMSIYASYPGISDDPDSPTGPPWIYQGSHVLPHEDDPRGGGVGLAGIPPHITRDGRDDRSENELPHPWLRLSLDMLPTDDPAVVLNPAQVRELIAQLTGWLGAVEPGRHIYLSTSCLHGRHGRCSAPTATSDHGETWTKTPSVCKFCKSPCVCPCHPKGRT
ncbi:hypothetical protein [Streptomyces aidingensis]|uniref:Uncharacterized protein n=1 Tax=Streptomyces aidingensis TaxID=910347 RepID=A0A1I1Q311_9ACTN|nr:hypothetical protein [Streptomyces aidingensis]SFD13623.1 hypothetical protein SAMN05421773_11068 [Streptomyces aidingensis]